MLQCLRMFAAVVAHPALNPIGQSNYHAGVCVSKAVATKMNAKLSDAVIASQNFTSSAAHAQGGLHHCPTELHSVELRGLTVLRWSFYLIFALISMHVEKRLLPTHACNRPCKSILLQALSFAFITPAIAFGPAPLHYLQGLARPPTLEICYHHLARVATLVISCPNLATGSMLSALLASASKLLLLIHLLQYQMLGLASYLGCPRQMTGSRHWRR